MGEQPVAFLVGRMNPPTPGHIELLYELITFARSIDAIPRAYITLSHNEKKMTKTQKRTDIVGLAKEKVESSTTQPYVKHSSYENPLDPDTKKRFIQLMLYNKYGIVPEESEEIVVIQPACNGMYKAIGCVTKLQPDLNKVYFVMGRELDPEERIGREKLCINKSDESMTFIPSETTDNDSKTNIQQQQQSGEFKVRCHFLERTEDEGISGLSGSKIRLLAANRNYATIFDVYNGYLTEEEIASLIQDIQIGVKLTPLDSLDTILASAETSKPLSQKVPSSPSSPSSPSPIIGTKRQRQMIAIGGKRRTTRKQRQRQRKPKQSRKKNKLSKLHLHKKTHNRSMMKNARRKHHKNNRITRRTRL